MLLATAAEMRHLDQTAIQDYSIPSIVLMENAGRTVVSAMVERYGALTGKKITIHAINSSPAPVVAVDIRLSQQKTSEQRVT